jgi:myosin protein heavy chain
VLCRERQNQAKVNRRLEKKIKELMLAVEDERRNSDQYKEQVCINFIYAFI